jgi:hypothetical protein
MNAFAEFEPSIFSHGAMAVVTHFHQDVPPEAREAAAEDHEAFKRGLGAVAVNWREGAGRAS